MEQQLEKISETPANKFGLSRKTNIALAGIAAIATAKDSINAVIAITVVTLTCVIVQYFLDMDKNG